MRNIMSSPLNDEEIDRISQRLSSDYEAASRREEIYGILKLPHAALDELKRQVSRDGSGNYGFFRSTLQKYRSQWGSKATVQVLIEYLRELKFNSAVEAIEKPENSNTNGIWFNVNDPIESFTGREPQLKEIHESLTGKRIKASSVKTQTFVVSGLGGIGKSELVRKYAWNNYNHYQRNGIWLNAETEKSLRASLVELLESYFKIPEAESGSLTTKKLVERVYRWFSDKNQKCLIVFDNVEEFDVINLLPTSSLPFSQIPDIIITSRKEIWRTGITLEVLTSKEATDFVNANVQTGDKTEVEIRNLVTALQCLPLALQQAVAYIHAVLSQEYHPVKTYLELFESQQAKELLKYKTTNSMDYEKTTLKTWSLTMQNIQGQEFGCLAIRIMQIISYFHPDDIYGCIFENTEQKYIDLSMSSASTLVRMSEVNANHDETNGAISLLKKYSMVTGPPGRMNVHRLVQRVIRLNNTEETTMCILKQGAEVLFIYMHPETRNDDVVKSVLPHAETLLTHLMKHKDLISCFPYLPSWLCEKLIYYGRYTSAFQLAEDSNPYIETVLGENSEYAIEIKYWKSVSLHMLARNSESFELSKQIYDLSKKEYGNDHKLTLLILKLVALNLGAQKRYDEALKILEEIIPKFKVRFGPEHRKVLTLLNNKANLLLLHDRRRESKQLFKELYEVELRVLGQDDLLTLSTESKLGNFSKKNYGILEKQEFIYESQVRLVGNDHPHVVQNIEFIIEYKRNMKIVKVSFAEQVWLRSINRTLYNT